MDQLILHHGTLLAGLVIAMVFIAMVVPAAAIHVHANANARLRQEHPGERF